MEPVVQAAPAVFTSDGYHAAALNQDGTINSAAHPAPGGTTVSIFATGLGPISPAAKDGAVVVPPLPANVFGVTAEIDFTSGIGGLLRTPVPVAYAGPAPFEVAGVSQINIQAWAVTIPGSSPRITLHAGNASATFTIYLGNAN